MPQPKTLKKLGIVALSFVGFVILISYLALAEILSLQQAGLMLVGMLGLYVGFGILIVVYRMINKLE